MVYDCAMNALAITTIVLMILCIVYLVALFIGKIIRIIKTKIDNLKWNINSARECGEFAHRRIDDINATIFRLSDELGKLKGEKKNVKKKKRN